MQILRTLNHWKARFSHLVLDFPLRDTLLMLWQRFREDHLALTASSLTLTTLMAMVPFFVLMLAICALEVLVAGIQAYVFALLSSLYINDAEHLH